jgi:vacuolar-type H+-ATPase subunit E/Vma4
MPEDIKGLIEKINTEGVRAAEIKASEIEAKAKKKAEEIILKAQEYSARLLLEAKEEISLMEAKQKILLTQAGRDFLLGLRKEINSMLERIIILALRQALDQEGINKAILGLLKDYASYIKGDVVISVKKDDLEPIKEALLAKLQGEVKKGILIKPSEEISGGFTISFDAGKSSFDFSDKAMAEYIGSCLKPKLKELLDGAVKQG